MSDNWIKSKFTEIYIKGLTYYGNYWVDDQDELIEKIVNSLQITNFEYMSIALNLSQVFATSQAPTQYSGIVLFFKNVTYNGKEYLLQDECSMLRQQIKNCLTSIKELQIGDIEIRTNSLTRRVY